jgi:hypothetical protein
MSMILHFAKFRLFNCNGSRDVSTKQRVNFKFQPSAMFALLVSHKNGLLEGVRTLKIYQCIKCHGPKLTGESFASISKV